ncbi:MAG: DUF4124 domain-containing protein [Pseudomonadales bacterium]
MNGKQLLVALGVSLSLAAGSVLASEIYRYTDSEGNVHYVDRPTGDPSETRMSISSKRTNPNVVQARVQARNKVTTERREAAAAAPKEKTVAEKRADRKKREAECQSNRQRMETMIASRRVYRENDSGEREYLDDAQRQEARDKIQELIEESCN